MPALLRLRQGLRALTAWTHPVDEALAASVLPPDLLALFHRLRRAEQLHSLRVLRDLIAAGECDPALLAAALLHDVGKTVGPFSLPERVIVVLVRKAAPTLYARWSRSEPYGWRRPFAISRRHPEWSAQMAADAGADARTVELCRRHAEALPDPPRGEIERLLAVLQAADDRN